MLSIHHDEIVRRFISCNLPGKAALNLALRLELIEKHHGTKTVVDVLKGLQSYFLGHKDNQPFTKKVHEDGTLFGDFRPLSRLAMKGRVGLKSALRCVKIYGLLEAEKPGAAEFNEFKQSLLSKEVEPRLIAPLNTTPEDCYLADLSLKEAGRFDSKYPLGTTRAPIPFGKTKMEMDVTPEEHLLSLRAFPHLLYDHSTFIGKLLPIGGMSISKPLPGHDCAGRVVGLTKDRGMKIRFIANPFRTIQLILSRLKNTIENFLGYLPESAVSDQVKGMKWVKNQLLQGKKLYSLDLSRCTDNLPLVYQVSLLKDLFPSLHEDIEIFEKVSRMVWNTPFNTVCWETGQPLGTGPSFASFTIFHIFLVRALGGSASNFRVIGDDIVISSKPLAKLYQIAIQQLGVEISMSKSLFDSHLSEFAGRIIDKHGVFNVYKASPTNFQKDPLGLIRQYGEKGLKGIKVSIRFKQQLKLCYKFFYSQLTPKELDMIDEEALFELFFKTKPILVGCRPIPSVSLKKGKIVVSSHHSGEVSGIPPCFIQKVIGYDSEKQPILDFRHMWEASSIATF